MNYLITASGKCPHNTDDNIVDVQLGEIFSDNFSIVSGVNTILDRLLNFNKESRNNAYIKTQHYSQPSRDSHGGPFQNCFYTTRNLEQLPTTIV